MIFNGENDRIRRSLKSTLVYCNNNLSKTDLCCKGMTMVYYRKSIQKAEFYCKKDVVIIKSYIGITHILDLLMGGMLAAL